MRSTQVIVFLGPSLPVDEARRIVEGDYRRPVRRGDLTAIEPGTVVAMIDGVFEQNLAVSVQEVHEALRRGVVIFGGGSMGALRAAEVPGVVGVGRIFEWYRDGIITRDDEVALLFAESCGRALTVPTVNVRFAVDRLRRLGTIDQETSAALMAAALSMHYKERTYRSILQTARLIGRRDSCDLIEMLQAHDLKYLDAQAVLEAADRYQHAGALSRAGAPAPTRHQPVPDLPQRQHRQFADEALIWESGDRVRREDLIDFLVYTGGLELHVADAAAGSDRNCGIGAAAVDTQSVFNSVARRWGWMSSEEAQVTLHDLGLDLPLVDTWCRERVEATTKTVSFVREQPVAFRRRVLSELLFDGLALKRGAMRLGSLEQLARCATEEPTQEELSEAEQVLCKVNGQPSFPATRRRWQLQGLADLAAQSQFLAVLARARRVGRTLVRGIKGLEPAASQSCNGTEFVGASCAKAPGEVRFVMSPADAELHARRIGQTIGITRIGMIGELGDLGGIQVAQAARPGNAWSSSYGSGKSRTAAGAIVGSIMEETEKWAQEQFRPQERPIHGSYADLAATEEFIDPATLDLPYDSVYHPEMPLHWHPWWDLLSGRTVQLPVDVVQMRRGKHDIYYTARGARKHFATNGLASGFSRAEAVLHGLCEYVERHAQRMAEVLLSNPGGLGPHPYHFVDLGTASHAVQEIAARLSTRTAKVRVLNITSEIRIPTFFATITRDMQRADGYGTHPDPNIAIEMAVLEAAQTIASATAGGREDLSIHARSLGRHERPRPVSVQDTWFWLDPDAVHTPVSAIAGFTSPDICAELQWCLERVRAVGVQHVLVADLTPSGIEPAVVVRVVVPGLETNNPFYTGPRARLLLLRDLLPRWL